MTFLRSVFATAILLLVVRSLPRTRAAWRAALPFGIVMAGMNACFYEAIARLPLGAAVTIEFWGPIAVAVVTSHRRTDLVWVALAVAGVALLGQGFAEAQPAGLAFIVAAGGFWALYIVLGRRLAQCDRRRRRPDPRLRHLGRAARRARPRERAAEPARRRGDRAVRAARPARHGDPLCDRDVRPAPLPARTFSVLLSMHPAVAALVGAAALSQGLAPARRRGDRLRRRREHRRTRGGRARHARHNDGMCGRYTVAVDPQLLAERFDRGAARRGRARASTWRRPIRVLAVTGAAPGAS